MSPFMTTLTNNGNYFFTAIFAIESFVKLAAMSPRYFFQVRKFLLVHLSSFISSLSLSQKWREREGVEDSIERVREDSLEGENE